MLGEGGGHGHATHCASNQRLVPGTEVATESAAALAAASIVFRADDPAYAEKLLDTAMTIKSMTALCYDHVSNDRKLSALRAVEEAGEAWAMAKTRWCLALANLKDFLNKP